VRKVDNRKGGKTAWEVRHNEHLGILEAIKNHQADEAEQRMISHVRGSAERVV
jgi:DNA-binding GntR family transcriptional regulator